MSVHTGREDAGLAHPPSLVACTRTPASRPHPTRSTHRAPRSSDRSSDRSLDRSFGRRSNEQESRSESATDEWDITDLLTRVERPRIVHAVTRANGPCRSPSPGSPGWHRDRHATI